MSVNGSKKEEMFKLILFHHPHYIEELLNTKFSSLEYEAYVSRRYFDLLGTEKNSNLKIIIEVQLNKSDHDHFERLESLLDTTIDNAKIVWIARDFHPQMVESIIQDLNYEYTKNVDFFAITFDEAMNSIVEQMNLLPEKEKYHKIINFNGSFGFNIFDSTQLIPSGLTVKYEPEITNPNIIKNKYLIKSLRKFTPWNLNLYRTKSRLDQASLLIGAGKSYIHYKVSICRDDLDYSFINLALTEKHGQTTFNLIKRNVRSSPEFHDLDLDEKSNQIIIRLKKEKSYKEDSVKLAKAFNSLHTIVSNIVYDTYMIV